MYALIKFYDGVHYVCSSSNVYNTESQSIKAKYSNGFCYPANVIAKNDDKYLLETICSNIESNKPYIQLVNSFVPVSVPEFLKNDYQRSILLSHITKTMNNSEMSTRNEKSTISNQDHRCIINTEEDLSYVNISKKEICDDENIQTKIDVDFLESDYKEHISVSPSYTCISKSFTCFENAEAMNDRMNTYNEEIANQDNSYMIDIEEDLFSVNITKKETCDNEDIPSKTDNFLEINYEKNICVSPSYTCTSKSLTCFENTTNAMNDRMSAHNEEIANQNHNYMIDIEEGDTKRRPTKKKTCDTINDQNEINVNSLETEECQRNICVLTSYKDINKIKRYCDLNANNKETIHIQNCLHKENVTCVNTLATINSDNESTTINETDSYKCNRNSMKSTTLLASSDNNTDEDSDRFTSSVSSLDTLNTNNGKSICNDEIMYVETSNTKSTKQNCCVFCNKLQSQLARHLITVHRNKPEVKKFAVLPKRHPERLKIIETIRKNGNFKFNTQTELNSGQLIVSRRPNKKTNKTATDFIACVKCKGFFAKNAIRHHARVCLNKNFQKDRNVLIMGRRIAGRLHPMANETLRKTVFPIMREDKVTRIVRYDELLIRYANRMCVKYKASHQHDMIRARLRLLGRFLLALKNINTNVQDFQSMYHPRLYNDCISAINIVAGYDNKTQLYKTPAVASTLSTLIKHLGNILIMECIKEEDKKKLVQDFIKLLVLDIRTNINKIVKRHKKINLPSLDDIKKLHTYLTKQRSIAYTALKESFSYEKWLTLAEVTLTSIYVFNRRRPGEMERAEIENFKHHEKVNNNMFDDINLYESLSIENKRIAEKYVQFCIKGQLGRAPVLLSSEMFDCIKLLLKFRIKANVSKKNPFIFGLPGFDKNRYRYLRVCVLMRKFACKCNTSESITLHGTKLRKYIAKHCIQFHLNDEVLDLATHRTDKILKKHYRQSVASRDILLRYLEAIQENEQNSENKSESDSDSEKENTLNQNISTDETAIQENEQNSENEFESDSDSEKENTLNQNIRNTDETDIVCNSLSNSIKCKKQTDKPGKRKRNTSPYGKTKRVRWTEDEKQAVLQAFAPHVENHTLPSLHEIQEVKRKYDSLAQRSLSQIKTWLHNQQKKHRQL